MTEKEFETKMKNGEIEEAKIEEPKKEVKEVNFSMKLEDYKNFLELLRQFKPHVTTAPTQIPKSFIEQIEFYDDGVNFRTYFYINKTWRYVALT